MKNVLILCTGNSCRSQIAHGYLAEFLKNKANVYSAGIETHGVNPKAIQTMQEDGVDIRQHSSNHIDEYKNIPFDYVITVCDNAAEKCPIFFQNTQKIHHSFEDPAKIKGDEDTINAGFRKIRDQIKMFCKDFSEQKFSIAKKSMH